MIDEIGALAQSIRNLDARLREIATRGQTLQQWQVPVMLNGWTNSDGYAPVSYWKDPNGIVHLRGRVTGGAAGTAIFSLPAGYRPEYTHDYVLGGSRVEVRPDGNVVVIALGTNAPIDVITFRAHQ